MNWLLYLFDDNKIKMLRKPGNKHKENPAGCTGKVKYEKEIEEGYREDNTGTACILVWR